MNTFKLSPAKIFAKTFILSLCFICLKKQVHAQGTTTMTTGGVSIVQGPIPPDPTALLDAISTNKGMLIPRLHTSERLAIANPKSGLLVFDIDVKAFYHYDTAAVAPKPNWRRIFTENLPADNYGKVPLKGVIMYKGPISDFDPTGLGSMGTRMEGWALCNGNNGTPDLRGKFVVSYDKGVDANPATNKYSYMYAQIGAGKGDDKLIFTDQQLPKHNHTVTVGTHQHEFKDTVKITPSTTPDGNHTHSFHLNTNHVAESHWWTPDAHILEPSGGSGRTFYTGTPAGTNDGAHFHPEFTIVGHFTTKTDVESGDPLTVKIKPNTITTPVAYLDNRPPSKVLMYIMRVK